ncbi:MAG: DUF1804 family protein [Acidobacteria bacterium]|nr:DUF1804 family protein [Acidobacteriota bacterium]
MARHSKKTRERAREMYLTGECTSLTEIARRLKVKSHTVGRWKRDEDWDGLRLKIERRAAEQMAERIASDRVELNDRHFKGWNVVFGQLFDKMQNGDLNSERIRNLERVASILDRAQKGQRLARGLSLDGKVEEQIRAEAAAENRGLVDAFIDIVKTEVTDEDTQDRIARALFERCPTEADADATH